MNDIADLASLRAHMGPVSERAARKVLRRFDQHCRAFIELSPFLVIGTADRAGRVDASPRGDPPGFVRVLDDTTLLVPDRPGNSRVDTFSNILENPGVGLIFFVPGVDETLRVNGSATLLTDAAVLDGSAVAGRAPRTGLRIALDEAYFHCAKALKRGRLWDPAAQIERQSFPSLGRILADQQGLEVTETEAAVAVGYRDRMY